MMMIGVDCNGDGDYDNYAGGDDGDDGDDDGDDDDDDGDDDDDRCRHRPPTPPHPEIIAPHLAAS